MDTPNCQDAASVIPAIQRSTGITASERYLQRLCERTFLSLWSYPGVYRDQGRARGAGSGKEVCDLLVVFEDHIIIFSDKHCEFRLSGHLQTDWSRWFRRTVLRSANQVWGAERWIKSYPSRLFLDRACTQPFPIELPDVNDAKVHRVVVAHDASRRCREALGGSGSLMIAPHIVGAMHCEPGQDIVRPFTIGQLDPAKGFVHVFDDTAIQVALKTLDTITDFVNYLTKKEQLIQGGRLGWAAGEDDLLAYYLGKVNDRGEHDFVIPSQFKGVIVEEGFWERFQKSAARLAQIKADKVSYLWDAIIEQFGRFILAGTCRIGSQTVGQREKAIRLMARESRFRRRYLSKLLLEFMEKVEKKPSLPYSRSTRVVPPTRPGDPYYVFLLFGDPRDIPYEEYREARRKLLEAMCIVVKLRYPDALDIVGLATEPGLRRGHSQDALYMDARIWTDEHEAEARMYHEECGLLKEVEYSTSGTEKEYPAKPQKARAACRPARSARNSQCPCGSGTKFKRCCGRHMSGAQRSCFGETGTLWKSP